MTREQELILSMSEAQTQIAQPDAIAAAIARAQAAAAQALAAPPAAVPAPANSNVPATAPAGMPARRLTEADMIGQSMAVDEWINVNENGLVIGKNKSLILAETVLVGIDLEAVAYSQAIKFGNPARYRKTYDLVNDSQGGSWADTVAMAQRTDQKARPYRAADIPMVLLETVKVKGGAAPIEIGTVIGYSTSTTGFAKWDAFISDARRKALAGRVKVRLGYEVRSGNGNTWGVITYAFVETHEDAFPEKAPKAA